MSNSELRLTEWEQSVMRAIQAYQPGIVLSTLEEDRALASTIRVALGLAQIGIGAREVSRWSTASYQKYPLVNPNMPVSLTGDGPPPPPAKAVKDWMSEKDASGNPTAGILVLSDVEPILERDFGFVRLLRESLATIKSKGLRKTVVILNKDFTLPDELRASFMRFSLELPDVEHLVRLVNELVSSAKRHEKLKDLAPAPEIVRGFAAACCGLTEAEATTLFSLSLAKFKTIDDRTVSLAQNEKARILLAGGALAMQEPRFGFDNVGGLENAKAWADEISPIIADPADAKAFGLKIPSGLLLVGVPGTGKSLLAEALAKQWRLPLLRFDVGTCFGSLVGESERNIRRMIDMANALKPCVVFIDEIEKGLGGDSLDGGTTSRVKQSLLTWLQEKPESVFVVATANDLQKLSSMPELIRSGRFDQKFFVDLPDTQARVQIFKIHMRRSGHDEVSDAILADAARATARYSGAEIEVVVQQALRFAFGASPRKLTREMLLRAVGEVKPLADTMSESIARLRSWCADGRAKLAGGTLEQDVAAAAVNTPAERANKVDDLVN